MFSARHESNEVLSLVFLCRLLYMSATWIQVTSALPQNASSSGGSTERAPETLALIPSAPPRQTALIPSAPPPGLIPSAQPPGLIPSKPPALIPSKPPTSDLVPISTSTASPGPIPSPPITSTPVQAPTGPIPSAPPQSNNPLNTSVSHGGNGSQPVMGPSSTEEGLRPIPPAETTPPDDPDGHHEIPEPNFSVTVPCKGCSPIVEISVTGWLESPAADHAGTTMVQDRKPPVATITAGPSEIVISPEPSGNDFIVGDSSGSATVTIGQTVIFDHTPIVIQTSSGKTDIIVGTKTVSLKPAQYDNPDGHNGPDTPDEPHEPQNPQDPNDPSSPNNPDAPSDPSQPASPADPGHITSNPQPTHHPPSEINTPLPPVLTIGSTTLTPDPSTHYTISHQTLAPGGPAITVVSNGNKGEESETSTISLLPSATAIVINDKTTTLDPPHGAIYTTTTYPLLTLNHHIYTANRAGFYSLAPGTTLIPGGPAVTISGTVIRLEAHGTAAIVQGTTRALQPVTTVVTTTRSGGSHRGGYTGPGGSGSGSGSGGHGGDDQSSGLRPNLPYPTTAEPSSGAVELRPVMGARIRGADRWLGGLLVLGILGFGRLAVWL